MRKLVRFYPALDGEMILRVTRVAVDDEDVEHDATDNVVVLYDSLPESKSGLALELAAKLTRPPDEGDGYSDPSTEAIVECPRTRLRRRCLLTPSDDPSELYAQLSLPMADLAEKVTIVGRVTGSVDGTRRVLAQSEPVEVRLVKRLPPGSEGFVRTHYVAFQDEPAVPEEYKRNSFYVSFAASDAPIVYINREVDEYFESFWETNTGQSRTSKVAKFSQAVLRAAVGGALTTFVVSWIAKASTLQEDEIKDHMPSWVFSVVDWLSKRPGFVSLASGYNEADRIKLLVDKVLNQPEEITPVILAEIGELWKFQSDIRSSFSSMYTSLTD